MTSTDPSLDARIWAYVRGEGGHAERKKLESEVNSDPAAARRYASIKLMHQRELAHRGAKSDTVQAAHSRATPKSKSGHERSNSAAMTSSDIHGKVDAVILVMALLLTIASLGLHLARANWPPLTQLAIRDGLHLGAALLAVAMAFFGRRGRIWMLTLVVGCIAATCATAAMLVR